MAQSATAVAQGETGAALAVDPAADREIHHVMSTLRLVSTELSGSRGELELARERLVDTERLVLVDPLTGAWNRRHLDHALREGTKRYARHGQPFALLLIDVDRFKRINDAHGHVVGDALLKGIADTIGGAIRSDIDVLVRFGGEEFIALLPETDSQGGLAVAERIRRPGSDRVGVGVRARHASAVPRGVNALPARREDPARA